MEREPPIEYRGRPLPAYRVELEDGHGTVVHVDAHTGKVPAWRNGFWRTYDFLWSLHIMDYSERESFNEPLLVAAAGLGVMTVLSGTVLVLTRFVRWGSRRGSRTGGVPRVASETRASFMTRRLIACRLPCTRRASLRTPRCSPRRDPSRGMPAPFRCGHRDRGKSWRARRTRGQWLRRVHRLPPKRHWAAPVPEWTNAPSAHPRMRRT